MDEKTLHTLEYHKVLSRLAEYTDFEVSRQKALALHPTTDLATAHQWLAETNEARLLLDTRPELTIGGARPVAELAKAASRGAVLTPSDFLDIQSTLAAAHRMERLFDKAKHQYPRLFEICLSFPEPFGLIESIKKTISERGEILDTASEKLGNIRRDLNITHDRLLSRMQKMLTNSKIAPFLQEALITQREGRYVLPIRAEAKGRVRAVVHDQSSSGATLFVEPLQVVELNNEWRELQLSERDEERKFLTHLSTQIGEHAGEIITAVDTLAELDLSFARAKYAIDLCASEPLLKLFEPKEDSHHPGVTIRLWQARHPLLEQESVIPIDVEFDAHTYVLVITGPNTGGKTVTLKTVGLLALMAQSGLHIPAQSGSEISLFDSIYADIGDEQSIEQSLSTFSGHITNIIRVLEKANPHSLVLIDELGAGTDPQEGAALARAILTYFVEHGITMLVATHYPELKNYAHATPGIMNASVEFDLETLQPTYHLSIGLPGRSNALAIAKRLGLPEEIVGNARQMIDPTDLRSEDLLDEIHLQRNLARTARAEADHARQEVESTRIELANRLEKIEDERLEILSKARHTAQTELEKVNKELRKVRRELARARQPLEAIEHVSEQIAELEEKILEPVTRQVVPESTSARTLRLGDKVRIRTLDQKGIVTTIGKEEAEVQVGVLRVRARLSDLELQGGEPIVKVGKDTDIISAGGFTHESPGTELSLRGLRVDEALESLDRHLDSAYLARLPYVRIIHGKGTGRLRQAVRQTLQDHPHVKKFERGKEHEGGDGVTIVSLKQE